MPLGDTRSVDIAITIIPFFRLPEGGEAFGSLVGITVEDKRLERVFAQDALQIVFHHGANRDVGGTLDVEHGIFQSTAGINNMGLLQLFRQLISMDISNSVSLTGRGLLGQKKDGEANNDGQQWAAESGWHGYVFFRAAELKK